MNRREALVYIVDDDPSFSKSIGRLLRTAGFEIAAFESASSFLTQGPIRHPACLLLDVRLPDFDGFQLQQKMTEQDISLPVIFMTGHGDIPMGVKAMKRGAIDFLPKPFASRDLIVAVNEALNHDMEDMRKLSQVNGIKNLLDTLTPRELEILRWVITGKLNKQIASALGIAEKTVKIHRSRVMLKTRVSSVAELVRLAEQANISPAE